MRSPLQIIDMTSKYLSKLDAGTDVATSAVPLSKSTHSLKVRLDDLLDFNRTKLGIGITISPVAVDLAEAFAAELEQLQVAHPGRSIALEVPRPCPDVHGQDLTLEEFQATACCADSLTVSEKTSGRA
jgi:hypothetical protein